MKSVFLLLIIYQIKHFLADYPLQGKYMLGKFKGGTDWIAPLLAHVAVHGAFTFVIAFIYITCTEHDHTAINMAAVTIYSAMMAFIDASIHFAMDRIKASPNMLGRFKALSANEYREIAYEQEHYIKKFPGTQTSLNMQEDFNKKLKSNVLFWWCLGIDQMVHHLTHYGIIYLILVTT